MDQYIGHIGMIGSLFFFFCCNAERFVIHYQYVHVTYNFKDVRVTYHYTVEPLMRDRSKGGLKRGVVSHQGFTFYIF